jgi:hypothetical protein
VRLLTWRAWRFILSNTVKLETPTGPVWHRYNYDGHGDHEDGAPLDGTGIGRGRPLFAYLIEELARFGANRADDYKQFYEMVNHKSGLLGVSEISSDMRVLLTQDAHEPQAAEAVALFCYQAKKSIGSFAAALGGLDTLVFAGGIGENAPRVRARICDGLGFLGIDLSESRNAKTAGVISTDASRVTVRVIQRTKI